MSLSLPVVVAPAIAALPGFATLCAQTGAHRRQCNAATHALRVAETGP